jgi:hypothetical protein
MPNSNDLAGNEKLWERVLSLLVVGASVLGGSAVLLIQALPPILASKEQPLGSFTLASASACQNDIALITDFQVFRGRFKGMSFEAM